MQVEKQLEAAYEGSLTAICLNELKHEIAVGDDAGEIKYLVTWMENLFTWIR